MNESSGDRRVEHTVFPEKSRTEPMTRQLIDEILNFLRRCDQAGCDLAAHSTGRQSRACGARELLAKLDPRDEEGDDRMITVRLGATLHERVKEAAHHTQTSMNRFCVSALRRSVRESLPAKEAKE